MTRVLVRWINRVALLAGVAFLSVLAAPGLLAFPHRAEVRGLDILSDRPIAPGIDAVLARADALVAAGPLAHGTAPGALVLTDGGWRWRLLSIGAPGTFALVRPLSRTIVVNGSDIAADRVSNGRAVGGARTLSGVVAHERTHLDIRARYGLLASLRAPAWLIEGLGDHVARESSLDDAAAAALRARGETHPALLYHDGRRRVERALAAGVDVDALFAAPARAE